jgi:hypothetical protein
VRAPGVQGHLVAGVFKDVGQTAPDEECSFVVGEVGLVVPVR